MDIPPEVNLPTNMDLLLQVNLTTNLDLLYGGQSTNVYS